MPAIPENSECSTTRFLAEHLRHTLEKHASTDGCTDRKPGELSRGCLLGLNGSFSGAMGRSERGPPDISVERLRSLTEEEKSYYWKLYKKLGGRRRCLHISMVQQFLLRSKLESETITKILETAVISSDEVDFESFCVACRLIAQAQELGFIGSVSDLPAKPPWFAEEQSAEGQQATEFDFEGVALGVESAGWCSNFCGPQLCNHGLPQP